jgi:hypothetical protein
LALAAVRATAARIKESRALGQFFDQQTAHIMHADAAPSNGTIHRIWRDGNKHNSQIDLMNFFTIINMSQSDQFDELLYDYYLYINMSLVVRLGGDGRSHADLFFSQWKTSNSVS